MCLTPYLYERTLTQKKEKFRDNKWHFTLLHQVHVHEALSLTKPLNPSQISQNSHDSTKFKLNLLHRDQIIIIQVVIQRIFYSYLYGKLDFVFWWETIQLADPLLMVKCHLLSQLFFFLRQSPLIQIGSQTHKN